MEETLGKRISTARKALGLTQDALAEKLGVTAQAVSKWENGQSCPDITILPKLSQIFGMSVDTLLGVTQPEPEKACEAEIVTEPEEETGGKWEFHYDAGRKPHIWFAVWVLLMGGLMLARAAFALNVTLWALVWTSALLLFGLHGIYPKFSFFRLGCALFGGYFILEYLGLIHFGLDRNLLLPSIIILLGLSLLAEAFRKPKNHRFFVTHNGRRSVHSSRDCTLGDDSFDCSVSFSEASHLIRLPVLRRGTATASFGELTVDLSECQTLASDCRITADCSFGELTLQIPSRFRAEVNASSSFASVEVYGEPQEETEGTILVDANASFGEICVNYI